MLKRMNFYVYRKGKRVSKEKLVKKQKGMIITAAVLLAAAAVVTGSRLIRHPEKSNTKKSEVADQENSEKEQDHRTSGTELSEKKQNMNKSITEEAFYISKIPTIFLRRCRENHTRQIVPYRGKISAIFMCSTWGLTVRQKRENLW